MFRADFPPFALETVEHSRHLPLPCLHVLQERHIFVFTPQCHQEAMGVASPPGDFCVSCRAQAVHGA